MKIHVLIFILAVFIVTFADEDYMYTSVFEMKLETGGGVYVYRSLDSDEGSGIPFLTIGMGISYIRPVYDSFTIELIGDIRTECLFDMMGHFYPAGIGYSIGIGVGRGYERRSLGDVERVEGVVTKSFGVIYSCSSLDDELRGFGVFMESSSIWEKLAMSLKSFIWLKCNDEFKLRFSMNFGVGFGSLKIQPIAKR